MPLEWYECNEVKVSCRQPMQAGAGKNVWVWVVCTNVYLVAPIMFWTGVQMEVRNAQALPQGQSELHMGVPTRSASDIMARAGGTRRCRGFMFGVMAYQEG
jgi:hypothetical protein